VREKLVEMLTVFLCDIDDRYDHQTRLLPYLLDMLTDEIETVSAAALEVVIFMFARIAYLPPLAC